jgi:Ribbon-helix-helix protein, copG family
MSKRLQVEMSDEAYERLMDAAKARDTSLAEFVRRAINVDLFLRKQANEDGTVVVESKDGGRKEILVP